MDGDIVRNRTNKLVTFAEQLAYKKQEAILYKAEASRDLEKIKSVKVEFDNLIERKTEAINRFTTEAIAEAYNQGRLSELENIKIESSSLAGQRNTYVKKLGRRLEIEDATWGDIRNSVFANSIKNGVVTNSFAELYGLVDFNGDILPEAQSVVDRLAREAENEEA